MKGLRCHGDRMELMEALQAFGVLVTGSWDVHGLVQDNDLKVVPRVR